MTIRNQVKRSYSMSYTPKKLCAICQDEYYPRRATEWFCNNCYNTWELDIKAGQPWVKFCISSESGRRRQEYRNQKLVLFGDEYDIDEDGSVVRRYGV